MEYVITKQFRVIEILKGTYIVNYLDLNDAGNEQGLAVAENAQWRTIQKLEGGC